MLSSPSRSGATVTLLLVLFHSLVHATPRRRRVQLIGLVLGAVVLGGSGPAMAQDSSAAQAELDEVPRIVGGADALSAELEYPAAAREENVEGTVVVRFLVMPDGSAKSMGVEQSVHPLLDQEAERVIEHLTFTPGWKDGKAVLVAMAMPVRFDLDGVPAGSMTTETQETDTPEAKAQETRALKTSPDASGPHERMPVLIGGLNALREELKYPRKARRKGIEGRVFVRFVVSTDGVPTDVRVVEPVHPLLDEEAVRAVRELRFLPGIKDGDPVAVQMTIPISFGRK